jgi:ATP-dependent helicase/nuclease subunit B
VTAYSEVTLAHYAAQILQKNRRQNASTAIIAENDCLHLDVALRTVDEPVLALSARSIARPVLQTLALGLAVRWEPLDPRDLLAFLVHPVSPMNNRLRGKLAAVVAERPGIGGSEWNSAIEKHREFLREKFASDSTGLSKALKRAEEDLMEWVAVERFDPLAGAPGDEMASTCRAVASWAMGSAAGADVAPALAEQYARLAFDASELAAILQPIPKVTRIQLDRLLDQIAGHGIRSTHKVPEAGHAHRLNAPGALLEPVDSMLWWGFRERPCSPTPPWTKSEIQQLEQSGAELLSTTTRNARESFAVQRAVLAAKKRLIFMTPRRLGNEPVTHHPLRDRIEALTVGKPPVFDLDQYLADPEAVRTPALLATELEESSHRQLPGIRRWWKFPNGQHLGPRDLESFTSAQKFIFSPYQWVLEHKARLRRGVLFGNPVVHQSRQRGNLLHRFSELVFAPNSPIEWRGTSRKQVRQSLEAEWKKLLPHEGANLLLPGNRAQAESLFDEGERALWSLIEHLRRASVTKTHVNLSPPPAQFVGGELHGYIDLLVENNAGLKAIVDLKYNGHGEKREELANNLQLQLAVYGYLVANGARWPESAFFILKKCALLSQNNTYFPSTDTVRLNSSAVGLEACWNEFEVVWRWRGDLLDHGWIELTVRGSSPGDDTGPKLNSVPPIPRWSATDEEDRFNDFDALTGWEEDA